METKAKYETLININYNSNYNNIFENNNPELNK